MTCRLSRACSSTGRTSRPPVRGKPRSPLLPRPSATRSSTQQAHGFARSRSLRSASRPRSWTVASERPDDSGARSGSTPRIDGAWKALVRLRPSGFGETCHRLLMRNAQYPFFRRRSLVTSPFFRALAALIMVVGVGLVPAAAQTGQMFGELVGKVTDDQGGVLPGVTVTLSGPAAMGAMSAVTNAQGLYRFPAVNSGTYTLKFELAGFAPLTREG